MNNEKRKYTIKLTERQLEVLYDIVSDTRYTLHYEGKDLKALNKVFDKLDEAMSIMMAFNNDILK
jgi:hypothetical protein